MRIKTKIAIIYLIIGVLLITLAGGIYFVNQVNLKWQAMEIKYTHLNNIYKHYSQHYSKAQQKFNAIPLKKVYASNKTILNDLQHGDIKYAIININAEQGAIQRELSAK